MKKPFIAGQAPWDILLIGGASGSGKSQLSYPLARAYGVTVTEIDDLHAAVLAMTTPAQQPTLHFWDVNPDAHTLSPEQIVDLHSSVCQTLAPAIQAVIAKHVESGTPVVLEGDYLLPATANTMVEAFSGRAELKAIFVSEKDGRQLIENFLVREPEGGEQSGRAKVSLLLNARIEEACKRLNLPILPSRPWSDITERAIRMTNPQRHS